jgi:hypothetical protein
VPTYLSPSVVEESDVEESDVEGNKHYRSPSEAEESASPLDFARGACVQIGVHVAYAGYISFAECIYRE